ncbi:hypothetical protein NUSPORA_00868 [Nucleospora cyclopteri]
MEYQLFLLVLFSRLTQLLAISYDKKPEIKQKKANSNIKDGISKKNPKKYVNNKDFNSKVNKKVIKIENPKIKRGFNNELTNKLPIDILRFEKLEKSKTVSDQLSTPFFIIALVISGISIILITIYLISIIIFRN